MKSRSFLVCSLAALAVACGSAPAPNPSDGGTPAAPKALASLAELCDGRAGLSGQAILDATHETFKATFTPAGGGAASPMTIVLDYAGGAVECRARWDGCAGCQVASNPASVKLVMNARIRTDDGTFDEAVPASVTLAEDSAGSLTFDATTSRAAVKGSVGAALPGAWERDDVTFSGKLSAVATRGSVFELASNKSSLQSKSLGVWQ